MATILDVFNQRDVLEYIRDRKYPVRVGETLFPPVKKQGFRFEHIVGGNNKPVSASIHAFDTEAEIGSKEFAKATLDLALIKRKMPITEEEIMAFEQPRNKQEFGDIEAQIFRQIDTLVNSVETRIEAMRMEVLTKGKITVKENNLDAEIEYHVPEENQEILTGIDLWTNDDSDPIKDMLSWIEVLPVKPTRALTSNTVLMTLLQHPKVKSYSNFGGGILPIVQLDAILEQFGLPVIRTYDEVYRKQNLDGSYESLRYFDKDYFVMFGDQPLGETIYGTTPEEVRLMRDSSIDTSLYGNVLAMVYEENLDPVSTWVKAVATALPSFPFADEVFQAKVI